MQDANRDKHTVVHTDAKIIGRDKPGGPKLVLVAFKVLPEGDSRVKGLHLDTPETDAAELWAIDLAIEAVRGREGRFVLLCDHESVVSMLNRPEMKVRSKTRPILVRVREKLESNPSIVVREFQINEAHKLLNEYWNRVKPDRVSPR